ncbi:MAG: rod shape-determining protein, partial [Bacillota bacterium]
RPSGRVLAIGEAAKKMIGRTPAGIVATTPLRGGVIADFDTAKLMLQHFIRKNRRRTLFGRTRVVVGVPSSVTEVERRAVVDAALRAGCKEAYLIEEPLAAGIGAGLPVDQPIGNMVVDIGGGTTDIAILSLGGIVTSLSIRVAGNAMDEAIQVYLRKQHSLLVGERTAEDIKIAIGSALPGESLTMPVAGLDISTRLPRSLDLTSEEVAQAIAEPISQITSAARTVIERCPPELLGDVYDQGIMLTGGGSLLRNMATKLQLETGLPARVAENPVECVAAGTGRALEQMKVMHHLVKRGSWA